MEQIIELIKNSETLPEEDKIIEPSSSKNSLNKEEEKVETKHE